MGKLIVVKLGLVVSILVFSFHLSSAFNERFNTRKISIAGLVVNAQTLSVIESAKIYDSANNLLGETDKKGYFNITIDYIKTGALNFKLKVRKYGCQVFTQHENWADIPTTTKNIMYFGLQDSNSKVKSFSLLANNSLNNNNLNFDNVFTNFSKVKEQKEFDAKLETAKSKNENVFIQLGDEFYIVDNGGWIKINSGNDLIFLNNKQVLTADKLNSTIKRKDIKSMTPLDSKNEKFAIYTR